MKRTHTILALLGLILVLSGVLSSQPSQPRASLAVLDTSKALERVTSVAGRPVTTVATPDHRQTKAVAGELLVKISDPAQASALGDRVKPTGLPETYLLSVSQSQSLTEAADEAKQLAGVSAVTPNYVVTRTTVPNDTFYASNQWNLPKVGAPAAWDRTTGSSATVVASIDTGVNWNHQDLSAKMWTNSGDTPGNGLDDDGNGYIDDDRGMDFSNGSYSGGVYTNGPRGPMDDDGHGSLTASVIAAATNNNLGIAGVNWQAKIMPVKVLDTNGYGSLADVAAGIRYAAANGAKVINMSLGAFGLSSDFATDSAIDYAIAQNVTVVAASGNDSSSNTISYPGINSKVIAVGATDQNDVRASYSNAGAQLSVTAPGNSIAGVNAVLRPPSLPTLSPISGTSSLVPGAYRYSLTAYNAAGETVSSSPSGNENQITIGSGQQIRLTWSQVYGATGYKIYRTAVGGSEGTQAFLVNAGNVSTYIDTGSITPSGSNPPLVTTATLTNTYETASGTSLATPHVAGLASLLLGISPGLSPDEVRAKIEGSADKVAGMGGAARTDAYGYGRINAQRALAMFPPYGAAWAGQSAYPTVGTGEQSAQYVDFKNTGTQAWSTTGANPVNLGISNLRDHPSAFFTPGWISPNRIGSFSGKVQSNGTITSTQTINPGETARFPYTITIPAGLSGPVRQYVEPVIEGITWLNTPGVYTEASVQAKSYVYSYAGQTYPPQIMQPGQQANLSLDLTNSGTATWRRNGLSQLRVGTSHPRDRGSAFAGSNWASPNRLGNFAGKVNGGTVTDSDAIAPGETARFNFSITAPNQAGNLREYFQPLVEGYTWLADIGIYFETYVPNLVTAPDYDYNYVSQSAYPTVDKGGQANVTLRLRNAGKLPWQSSGANAVKLGTSHALDRASGFYTSGNWLAPHRIHLSSNVTDATKNSGGQTTIAPGEVGEFQFTITGTPQPGTYREFFQPLAEGVTWMKDIGLYWDMTVKRQIQVGLASQTTATMSPTVAGRLTDSGGQVLANLAANQPVTLIYTGGLYWAQTGGGQWSAASPLRVEQDYGSVFNVTNLSDNGNYNLFRGNLYLKNGNAGTYLVNDVNLEDYLKGGGEVPDSWPAEAVKAQAVAARTYAARKLTGPSTDSFNVYDDTRDQVYNGHLAELQKPNTSGAVDATRGVGIFYSGSLIQAFYSSDTGGASESNENVWGGSAIGYLRGVSDPYQRPDNWSVCVSNATLQANFGAPGNIDSINVLEYYPSGRTKTVRLSGSWGNVTRTYTADTMRGKFTTRSSLLTGLGRCGNDWVISGRGFGHGIGMGQWGAYNQANAGRNYQQILQFYYTGVTFGSVY